MVVERVVEREKEKARPVKEIKEAEFCRLHRARQTIDSSAFHGTTRRQAATASAGWCIHGCVVQLSDLHKLYNAIEGLVFDTVELYIMRLKDWYY